MTTFLSHNYRKNNFGLRPARLAYRNGAEKLSRVSGVAEAPKERIAIKSLEQELEKAKKAVEANEENITKKMGTYNDKYTKKDYFTDKYRFGPGDETKRQRTPQERPLRNLDFNALEGAKGIITQIENLKKAKFYYNDQEIPMSEIALSENRENQYGDLKELLNLLKEHKDLKEAREAALERLNRGSGARLVDMEGRIEEIIKIKTDLEKKKLYGELSKDYDIVIGRLIKDPEFKRFWEGPEGMYSEMRARENRNLFFSILKLETKDFDSKGFILGERFGNNAEENRKNFPFIYNEWVRVKDKKDYKTKIENQEADIEGKAAVAGVASIDAAAQKVKSMAENLNALVAENPNLSAADIFFTNPLDTITRQVKDKQYYVELGKAIQGFKNEIGFNLRPLEDNAANETLIAALEKNSDLLDPYMDLAIAHVQLKDYETKRNEINADFTRNKLNQPGMRQTVLEMVMKKYQTAMQIVDQPFKFGKEDVAGSFHRLLHPAVRRMAIATVMREGVARFDDKGEAISRGPEYRWMFAKLAQSKYFNRKVEGRFLDPEQREFLVFARYGNLALLHTKWQKGAIERIKAVKKGVKDGLDESNLEFKENLDWVKRNIRPTDPKRSIEDTIDDILKQEETALKTWEDLHTNVEAIMKDPSREKVRAYIDSFLAAPTPYSGVLGILSPESIKQFAKDMEKIDLDYNAMDFNERSRSNVLERMGIRIKAIYPLYENYLKEHPDLHVKYWDDLLTDPNGAEKLIPMFESIIPQSKTSQGKKHFLAILRTLHGKSRLSSDPETRDAQGVALNVFNVIKDEIKARENLKGLTAEAHEKALQKLEGMTFGDRITEYASGVIDMIIGPGQSIANRAAGIAILVMAYKSLRFAIKGKGWPGKLAQIGLLAGAAELALKHVTGAGMLDRYKITGVAEALKGTYDNVLLVKGESLMEKWGIKDHEHARALMEIKDVPFSELMEWYEKTDDRGQPRPGERDSFPRKIDIYNLLPGAVGDQKERRGRLIVKKTMENLFRYVGNKVQKDALSGEQILREQWVKAFKEPAFDLDKSKFTEIEFHQMLIERFRKNPKELTWQVVMQAEIDHEDVEEINRKSLLEIIKSQASETAVEFTNWTQKKILNPAEAGGKEIAKDIETRYGPKGLQFYNKMREHGASIAWEMKRDVEFWYAGNKHIMRQFGRDHWELLTTAAKLPFEVLYVVDKFGIPLITTKIRQMKEIIRPNKLVTIDRDLLAIDVMNPIRLAGLAPYELFDTDKNPEFRYFGIYQTPFYKAMTDGAFEGGYYYESEEGEGGSAHVGYLVTETTQAEAGIKTTFDTDDRYNKLQEGSYKEAEKYYLDKYSGLKPQDIDKYMYPIHTVSKTAGTDKEGLKTPEKLYVFWRMPLPQSGEYNLKELGRWPEYMDPNEYKHRPPFMVDPKKGVLDNLKDALGLESPALRAYGTYATIAVAQYLRLVFGMLKGAGKLSKGIGKLFKVKPKDLKWIEELTQRDESTLQKIDEYLGSAGNTNLALSQFYKKPHNADLYKKALEYARKQVPPKDLVLEDIKTNPGNDNKTGNRDWKKVTGNVDGKKKKVGRLNMGAYTKP